MRVEGPNPGGLCQCGCGQAAPIATKTNRRFGHMKDLPVRFIRGHSSCKTGPWRPRKPKRERRAYDVDPVSGCWVWRGVAHSGAYGKVRVGGHMQPAHRWMYEQHRGSIGPDRDLHHLCCNPSCVNPVHLEAVTRVVHVRRGAATKLTPQCVAEIRSLGMSPGGLYPSQIAPIYDVTPERIGQVLRGQGWKETRL